MTDPAKKVLDLQRGVQQAFLAIKEHCNPLTFISRKRAGNAAEFQLKRTIEHLTKEVEEIKKLEIEQGQLEMFLAEIGLLEQSITRLQAIFCLVTETEKLENMDGEEAALLMQKSMDEFNEVRQKYPFVKKDVEAEIAHTVYCLFMGVVTEKKSLQPTIDEVVQPLKRVFKPNSKCAQQCHDLMNAALSTIEEPTTSLHQQGSIEKQEFFSTEKIVSEIKKSADPRHWLSSLQLEKCKVSERAVNVLNCLKELTNLAISNPTNLEIARSVGSILQLYMTRAQPIHHCAADAAVYFNDCFYIVTEMERTKFDTIYKIENSTDGFNFAELTAKLRLNARNNLIRDLAHIKAELLTWPSDALVVYLDRRGNNFSPVLEQLKRFVDLWDDVCSRSVYAWLTIMVSAHILDLLVDTLTNLPNFERLTCVKALPMVNEIVDTCSGYIRISEDIMDKKLADLKFGQALVQKIDKLKEKMSKQGAADSLTELFDFKVVV
ncbi:hypothetical protein M3Y97_00616500 [Aphelenchoides bicaudatus]|nr:hypothetical protein M3Y97_00616500 [Aphelenchoides bicaudatus]